MQTFCMWFISRTRPYLPVSNLPHPQIPPACIIGVGPLCQMLGGRSHTISWYKPPPLFSFKPQLYTQIYRQSGCRKAHTKRHSPPLCSTPPSCCSCCFFFTPEAAFFMSLEVISEIVTWLTSCKRHNKVLLYQETMANNRESFQSIVEMYACHQTYLIVLILNRERACVCIIFMYSTGVCRIQDEHL